MAEYGADDFLGDFAHYRNLNSALQESVNQAPPRAPTRRGKEPPAFRINLERLSLGYLKDSAFVSGFDMDIFDGYMTLDMANFQELFMSIKFSDDFSDSIQCEDQLPDLQCTSNIRDIENVFYKEKPIADREEKYITLTVVLRRPPKLMADWRAYRKGGKRGAPPDAFRRATEDDWNPYLTSKPRDFPLTVLPRGAQRKSFLKMGLWTVYRLTAICSVDQRKAVRISLDRLRTFARDDDYDEGQSDLDVRIEQDILIYKASVNAATDSIEDYLRREFKGDFEGEYLTLGLISQGTLPPHHDSVGKLLHRLNFRPDRHAILSALYRLDHLRDKHMEAHVRNIEIIPAMRGPLAKDRIFIKRIVVTPTRVILQPPTIETCNRIINAWSKFKDRFLRVSFEDEDGPLFMDPKLVKADDKNPRTGILQRIRAALNCGIQITTRHYVFLATSESQLKEHGCWMICECPEEGFTADAVRAKMGNFNSIRNVAKYASRMGLCFSATRGISMDLVVEMIPDLEHRYHPTNPQGKILKSVKTYIYTDGIGQCSEQLAQKCAKAISGEDSIIPSAMQIRFQGFKGVLAVRRGTESNTICLRPSMSKFESDLDFGVMKIATHSHAHLNRQAISLLSHLGVTDKVFLTRMERQIALIKSIETNSYRLDNTRQMGRKLYRSSELPILQMLQAGFAMEPLLSNVLKCLECQLLQDLKYKARIQIEEGAFLMGISDEYNILKPGQIYVAIQPTGSPRKVITGPCIVYRSPSLHPGDIQTATAVDVPIFNDPSLGHIPTNVVVFSTRPGKRDLPSQLSGGDLDGDYYTIIWDSDFLINPKAPMSYEPAKATPLPPDQVITMDDIKGFILQYMKSNLLGPISTAHLARSDKYTPDHPDCITLAHLASDAVDFAKSGVPVKLPEKLMDDRSRPDFISGNTHNSWVSEKILGKLYRLIEPPPVFKVDATAYHPLDPRLMMGFVPVKYLKEAGKMKHAYNIELESQMRRHKMREIELWGGVNVNGENRKKRRERDSAVRGPVKEAIASLRSRFRKAANTWLNSPSNVMDLNKTKLWALAVYRVTRDEKSRDMYVDCFNESARGSSGSVRAGSTFSTGFSVAGSSAYGGRGVSMSPMGGALGEGDEYDEERLEEGEVRVTRVPLISFCWIWAHELCEAVSGQITIKEELEEEEEGLSALQAREEDEDASRVWAVGDA